MHNGPMPTQDPIRVAIVGSTGYAGAELVRLLSGHPHVELAALYARGREGKPLADEFPHLAPLDLRLRDGEPNAGDDLDVAFLTLPSGKSAELAVGLAAGGGEGDGGRAGPPPPP